LLSSPPFFFLDFGLFSRRRKSGGPGHSFLPPSFPFFFPPPPLPPRLFPRLLCADLPGVIFTGRVTRGQSMVGDQLNTFFLSFFLFFFFSPSSLLSPRETEKIRQPLQIKFASCRLLSFFLFFFLSFSHSILPLEQKESREMFSLFISPSLFFPLSRFNSLHVTERYITPGILSFPSFLLLPFSELSTFSP